MDRERETERLAHGWVRRGQTLFVGLALLAGVGAGVGCGAADDDDGTGSQLPPPTMNPSLMGGSTAVPPVGTAGSTALPTAGNTGIGTAGSTALPMAGAVAPMAGAGVPTAGSTEPVAGAGGTMAPVDPPTMGGEWVDPGTNPWTLVPEAMVEQECGMDIALLKATGIPQQFAVFRRGKLCYESGRDSPTDVFSCTKTVGGIVTGFVQNLVKDVPKSGPGTGQFHDYDLASEWGLTGYGQQQLGYLMAMATGSRSTMWGGRSFAYDTLGSAGLNPMGRVANRALMGAPMAGVTNMQTATSKLFEKLGMKDTRWGGVTYGTGAVTTLHDLGKLFTMMIHGGVYNKERLLSEEWVYKMTHPAFEDGNTSYGQFTWLNHRGNATGIGGDIGAGSNTKDGDPCSPAAFWQKYPHEISDAPDCQATVAGANCKQKYDIGNFSCQGLGGQFAIGHPGLDLVLVVKNFSGSNGPMGLWDKIRPAIVAKDPMFKGDMAAFCKAYGAGDYAPDLKVMIKQPPDPM